jgi:peptide/nickel transport system ATP-binding protein
MTSLNPVMKIGNQLTEMLRQHLDITKDYSKELALALLQSVGIPEAERRLKEYPHQMSGGMRQRVMISLALALRAKMVIADEPTTSLDVIVEAKFLDLLRALRDEFGLTILLITHNIGVVAEVADRVAVMYAGRMAEVGEVEDVFDRPLHPYTRGLLRSVPNISLDEAEDLYRMGGEPPNLSKPPTGCRFHPRCPEAMDICSRQAPSLLPAINGQLVNCWLYEDHPEKDRPTVKVT